MLDALRRFDLVAGLVLADTSRWVVTHGEPHAGNAIRTQAGNVVLVDWDTVAIAPHERDLWMLVDARHPDWSAYRDLTGVASLSEIAMEAYRDWWALSEIAIYVTQCHARHERTEDMEIEWAQLQGYLSELNPTPA